VQDINAKEAADDAAQQIGTVNAASLSCAPRVSLPDDHGPPLAQRADGSAEGEQLGPGTHRGMIETESRVTRVVILQVPECPMVDRARETVRRALERIRVQAEIEELVGDYPSPTVLINGQDVTRAQWGDHSACRLDLPTEDQVIAALHGNLG
jgi:hypothetical protein